MYIMLTCRACLWHGMASKLITPLRTHWPFVKLAVIVIADVKTYGMAVFLGLTWVDNTWVDTCTVQRDAM